MIKRKPNKATQEKVVALKKERKEFDQKVARVFSGLASPLDAVEVWEYIEDNYGHRSAARQTKDGAVDPIATGMAIGAQNVWLDLKKRIENGRLAGVD